MNQRVLKVSREKQKRNEPESVSNLREMILSKIVSEEMDGKREFSVAALLMKTIQSDLELYRELKEQAERLDELQDTVKDLALKVVRE